MSILVVEEECLIPHLHKTPPSLNAALTYLHDDDTDADGGNNDGIPNMEPSGQPLGVWGFWFGL